MTPASAGTPTTSPAELIRLTDRFVRNEVLPVEDRWAGDLRGPHGDAVRQDLQARARTAGVFAPHAPVEYGGHGLSMLDRAPVFEAAGYSTFGPIALGINAPDEGNLHLLMHVASDRQKEAYLAPLARGEIRSAFAMTEPSPGAGSDPSLVRTTARRTSAGWVLYGHKRFITGADGAAFFIVMARTSGEPGDHSGVTMFLIRADAAGLSVGRHMPTSDRATVGGHCEVHFDGVEVATEDVLGEPDLGFRYAQVRLGPARMTHVMRWLGTAVRAQDIALSYAAERNLFGQPMSNLGLAQQLIADNEIDLAASRALLTAACRALDSGERASHETSIAKTFAAEAICRVVDRSIQICGGEGVTDDLPLVRLAGEVRPFRIYDGPSEVHRWSIARRAARRHQTAAE